MKQIYFIRHGESRSNVSRVLEWSEAPLTERGCVQSKFLAQRFSTIPFDAIIASPFKRTQQTADIFNKQFNRPIRYSDLVREMRSPSEVYGVHESDPIRIEVKKQQQENRNDPAWRYSDEENFIDLKDRARNALDFIANQKEEEIVVITHSGFLRIMLTYILYGEKMTPEVLWGLFFSLYPSPTNTGITICQYDNTKEKSWGLVTWNDVAHLGDA